MFGAQVSACCFIAPFPAFLTSKYGAQGTAVCGVFLATIGWKVAGLAYIFPDYGLVFLLIGQSVCVGAGYGIMYVAALLGLNQAFFNSSGHGLANGFATSGSGVGQAGLVVLLNKSLTGLGLKPSYNLVLPLLCLGCGLLALFFLPGKKEATTSPVDTEAVALPTTEEEQGSPGLLWTIILGRKIAKHKLHKLFAGAMFADFMAVVAIYLPYDFLFPLAEGAGFLTSDAHFLLVPIGLASMGGRILAGVLCSCFSTNLWLPLYLTCGTLALAAPFPALLPLYLLPGSPELTCVCCCLGLFTGAWIATTSPLIISVLGHDLLDAAFSRLTFVRGLAAFLGPQLANLDAAAEFPFYLGSISFGVASVMFLLIALYYHCCTNAGEEEMHTGLRWSILTL